MKTIIPNQPFKHGRETYEKGESYEVPEPEAYYFAQCGWLEGAEAGAASAVVDLDIHDSQIGHTSEVK